MKSFLLILGLFLTLMPVMAESYGVYTKDNYQLRQESGEKILFILDFSNPNGKIIVVTHAFVIKTLLHLLDYNRLKDIGMVGNSSITIIGYDGNNFRVKDVIDQFQ